MCSGERSIKGHGTGLKASLKRADHRSLQNSVEGMCMMQQTNNAWEEISREHITMLDPPISSERISLQLF